MSEEIGLEEGSYGTTRNVRPLNSSTAFASPPADELLLLDSALRLPLLDDPVVLEVLPDSCGFLVGGSTLLMISCCNGLLREIG